MDIKIKTNDTKFKFRVSAIIINDKKILVNKYSEDSFCLPGGYVKVGEKSEDAIIREIKEETGMDFKVIRLGGITENFFTNLRGEKTHGIDFYYYLKTKNSKEINKLEMNYIENNKIYHHYRWIPLDEIEKYNILPNVIKKHINEDKIFHFVVCE